MLVPSDWRFVGEGNAHLVYRYVGVDNNPYFTGMVLKLLKNAAEEDADRLMHQHQFVQRIVIGDPFSQSHHSDGDCFVPGSNAELPLLGEDDDEEEDEGNGKDSNWRLHTATRSECAPNVPNTNKEVAESTAGIVPQIVGAIPQNTVKGEKKHQYGDIREDCPKLACRLAKEACSDISPSCVMKRMTAHSTHNHKTTDLGVLKYNQTYETKAARDKSTDADSSILLVQTEEPSSNSLTPVPNGASHVPQVKVEARVAMEQMERLERVYRQARRARQFFMDRGLVSPVHIPAQQLHLFENKHTLKLREQAVSKRLRSSAAVDSKILHYSRSCLSEDVHEDGITKVLYSASSRSRRTGSTTCPAALNPDHGVDKCTAPFTLALSDNCKPNDTSLCCGFPTRGLLPSRSYSCPPRLESFRAQALPSAKRHTISQPYGFTGLSQAETETEGAHASGLPRDSGVVENLRNRHRAHRPISALPFSYSFQDVGHLSGMSDSSSVLFTGSQSATPEGTLNAQDMRSSFALLENDLVTPPVSAERLLSVRESYVGKHLNVQNAGEGESSGWIYMTCELKPKTGLPALVVGLPDLLTEVTAPLSADSLTRDGGPSEDHKPEKELSLVGDPIASSFNGSLQLSHKSLNWGNPSRFTLQQELKLKQRAVKNRSFFQPEIFFGQLSSRQAIVEQLKALIRRPQNNCRIFLDGARIVWCEEQKSVRRPSPSPSSTFSRCTVNDEGNVRSLSKRHIKQKSLLHSTKTLRFRPDGRREEVVPYRCSGRKTGKRRAARQRLRKKLALQRNPHDVSPCISAEKAFFCHCLDVGTTAAPALSTIIASTALSSKSNACPKKRNYISLRQMQFLGPVSFLFGWTVSGLFPTPTWLLTRFFYAHNGEEIEVQPLCNCAEEDNSTQEETKGPKQANFYVFSTPEKRLLVNQEKTTKKKDIDARAVYKAQGKVIRAFPHQKNACCPEAGQDRSKPAHSKKHTHSTNVDLSSGLSLRGANAKVSAARGSELPNTVPGNSSAFTHRQNAPHSSSKTEDTIALLARHFLHDFPTEIRILPDGVASTNEALNAAVELFGEVVYRESNLFHRLLYVHALCEGQQCLADALFKELIRVNNNDRSSKISTIPDDLLLFTEDEQLTGSTAPSSFEEVYDIKGATPRSYKTTSPEREKQHPGNQIDATYLMSDSHAIPALQEFLQSLESEIAETKTNWNFQKTVVVPEVISENTAMEQIDVHEKPIKTTTVDPEALLARRIQLWHYSRGCELLRQCQQSSGNILPSLKQSVIHWIYRFLIGRTFLDCSVMLNVAITVNEDQSDVQRLAQNRFVKLCTISPLTLDPVVPDSIPCSLPLLRNGGSLCTISKDPMIQPPVNDNLIGAEQLLYATRCSTSTNLANTPQEEDDSIVTAKLVRHALQHLRVPIFNGRSQLDDYIRNSTTHSASPSQPTPSERIATACTSNDYIWKAFGDLLSSAHTHTPTGTHSRDLASHATVWYRVSVVDLDLKQASKIPQWATQLLDILSAQQTTTASGSPSPHSNATDIS